MARPIGHAGARCQRGRRSAQSSHCSHVSIVLTDTHCHVQTSAFNGERDAVLWRAAEAGVDTLVCVGYDAETWRAAQGL
ncbi:MAG: TatD family hydrolase, partial [Chloroflexota bacterium]